MVQVVLKAIDFEALRASIDSGMSNSTLTSASLDSFRSSAEKLLSRKSATRQVAFLRTLMVKGNHVTCNSCFARDVVKIIESPVFYILE